MDLSYLFSELLLAPGALLVMALGYYFRNLSHNVSQMMTEDETKELVTDKLAVVDVEFEAIKTRLERVELVIDRIEVKIDELLQSLPKVK